jgi:predicted dehydrogenase
VENEDIANAVVRFASGAQGSLSASRLAWGRKNCLAWEVYGTEGMITFCQERMNELRLYENRGPNAEQGFRTILSGPDHPPFDRFCPAAGHQLGFLDLKTIELSDLLRAIATDTPAHPSFDDALAYEVVIHAIAESGRSGQRISLAAG